MAGPRNDQFVEIINNFVSFRAGWAVVETYQLLFEENRPRRPHKRANPTDVVRDGHVHSRESLSLARAPTFYYDGILYRRRVTLPLLLCYSHKVTSKAARSGILTTEQPGAGLRPRCFTCKTTLAGQ